MTKNPKSIAYQKLRYLDQAGAPQTLAEGDAKERANAVTVATSSTYTQAEREAAAKALENGA
jgi:hypothetical protein